MILNESVLNGGIYQLFRFGKHVFLEPKGESKDILVGEKLIKNLLAESTDGPTVDLTTKTNFHGGNSRGLLRNIPDTVSIIFPTFSRPEVLEPTR